MSARAIAAAKSRGFNGERPLSAYEESMETLRNRQRRASVAVMPFVEREYRDRVIAGSFSSLSRAKSARESSPDFGAIRVQVEDITTDPNFLDDDETFEIPRKGDSFDMTDVGETSTETISEMNNTGIELRRLKNGGEEESEVIPSQNNNKMRMKMMRDKVVEWAVPSEYASSPIAQELMMTQCMLDERPRPQIPAIYMNGKTENRREDNDENNYSNVILRRNSSTSSSSMAKTVTLLEQIVRTHTIWYLPHLGRPEVVHLLKPMEPGNFIVRASTREKCMALSVRLDANAQIEIDHYIIEKLTIQQGSSSSSGITTNVVRLEGSSRTFRSLPMLIEHYCLNEEELETRLRLPTAILECSTTKQLQSIALMEQEFWTSGMSLSRRPNRSLSRSSVGSARSNNTISKFRDEEEASTWFMDKSIYDDVYENQYKNGAKMKLPQQKNGFYGNNNKFEDSSLKMNKKRRSSSRTSATSAARFATVCVGEIAYDHHHQQNNYYEDPIGNDETDSCQSSHSPPSKHDRMEENVSISRGDRRSQSVRSHKSVASTTDSIKNGGSSQTLARLSRPRSFLRSLLSFGSSSSSKDQKKVLTGAGGGGGGASDLANCEYFTPWDRKPGGGQVRTSRSAFDIPNSPARGFFAATQNHKKNGLQPSSSVQNTVDIFDDDNYTRGWKDALMTTTSAAAKASPGGRSNQMEGGGGAGAETMRTFKPPPNYDEAYAMSSRSRPLAVRKEIGIIKNNAQRLAYHNESSPGPPTNSGNRIPMTPPTNVNDPHVMKSCVEELRRKRLQSTNEMLAAPPPPNGTHSAHASPQISMRRRNNGFPSSPSTTHRAFAGIDRHRNGEHRLSVPNLIAAQDPMIPGVVGQSAKALKERMARNVDGELMVINEGLVTPVVRRKNFAITPKNEQRASMMIGNDQDEDNRKALESLINDRKGRHHQKNNRREDEMSSGGSDQSTSLAEEKKKNNNTESELIWRRAKQQQHSWSAVNFELKNRPQKIAKVLPTPQQRNPPMMVDVPQQPRRSSDYAQLCDFAATSSSSSGVHKIDDDAVSVAGTVFNEPWDSNVWENLLDLAHHGDDNNAMKVSEPIQEEDSDSDRTTAASTCQMDSEEDDDDEDEDEDVSWTKRALPSDRVVIKAWESSTDNSSDTKYNTLGSCATLKRNDAGSFSIKSLPRALSRFSQNIGGLGSSGSFGSIDDLPTTIPSMSPLLGHTRQSRNLLNSSPEEDAMQIGRPVQEYVEKLAALRDGENACFALTLAQFIACTKETKETDPAVVVRNVRQFINGMKNYLVKHGEGDLHRIIDDESARLNSNRILNIDAVLEAVLHKLLLREVKPLLYHVMVKEHSKSGTLQLISTNIGIVRKMNLRQMGFSNPEMLVTPSQQTMENIKLLMRKMQSHYSPMKKLENLMKAVSQVVACQKIDAENSDPTIQRGIPAADDLVRWLVYILARTSTVGCEVEAWYMWELLPQPILLQSDASYYLTALFSAVHVLKSAEAIRRLCENEQQVIASIDMSRNNCCSSPLLSTATLTRGSAANARGIASAACDAFVKIAVPDETMGCVRYATFPGVPMLTTSKLSRLVAHQQGITNPEEHGLYLIADGFESCLQPTDCPVMIHEQLKKENKPHLFAYKRHEAKIAWPRAAITAC